MPYIMKKKNTDKGFIHFCRFCHHRFFEAHGLVGADETIHGPQPVQYLPVVWYIFSMGA